MAEWRLTWVPVDMTKKMPGREVGWGRGAHEAGVSPCHASDLLLDPGRSLPLQDRLSLPLMLGATCKVMAALIYK